MQAAIGLAQLGKLDKFIKQRKDNFQFLYENLQSLSKYLSVAEPAKNSEPSWFGFTIRVKKNSPISRNEIVQGLSSNNIGTRLLFGGNLIKQPFLKEFNYRISGHLNNTDMVMENVFWLGVQPNLNKVKLDYIIKVIKYIFSKKMKGSANEKTIK